MTNSNDYCPKCDKKNDKVQFPSCGIPVTLSTDGIVISGPEDCPWGFPDIKPIPTDVESTPNVELKSSAKAEGFSPIPRNGH